MKKATGALLAGFVLLISAFEIEAQNMFRKASDFDGDGKGELALWRGSSGTWWWIRSSDGVVNAAKWGINGDLPVPADYDGDGKTDLAVWRSGTPGVFWINGSQNGISAFAWGTAGDLAVQY